MSNDKDNLEFTYEMGTQIQESEEEFIYEAISPFCETIVEKKLSKKELEKILRKGMHPSIPLDKVKEAREEIEEYKKRQLTLAIGVEDLEQGKQVALDYVITILDKLIESEENE